MSWQDAFQNYTTGMAFHIGLSHDQASLLDAIAAGEYQNWLSRTGRNNFIPAFRALERRGLAEHNPAAKIVGMSTRGVHLKWVYRLTPAGHHVHALLKLSGVIAERPKAESEAA